MSLHTKKQFAELCGKPQKWLQVYIQRKKVFVRKDSYVDDQVDANAKFLKKWIAKKSQANIPVVKKIVNKTPAKTKVKTKVKPKEKEKRPVFDNDNNFDLSTLPETEAPQNFAAENSQPSQEDLMAVSLETEKKQLDIALLKEKIEVERIKKEKLEGDVIPTDIVMALFSGAFKAVTNRFYQSAEGISQIMIEQIGGSREDMVEFRGKLIKAINEAVKDSQKDQKKAVNNIVLEYSQKRGVGERK